MDAVKQDAGNTNDGNTARKFFQNYNKVAEITGIDQHFIKRLYIIMQAMASGKPIDVNKLKKYCMDTAKIYVNKYMWYPNAFFVPYDFNSWVGCNRDIFNPYWGIIGRGTRGEEQRY